MHVKFCSKTETILFYCMRHILSNIKIYQYLSNIITV